MRLIDADALVEAIKDYPYGFRGMIVCDIAKQPTVDSVPVGAYEQTRWERDMAISQLEEIGKSLCEKMDNVATVVRCKDCKHWGMHKSLNVPWCFEMHIDKSEDGYCDCAERSE